MATEGIFVQFAKRGVADIGYILATSDKEMDKKDPVPQGWERNAPGYGFGRLSIFRSQRRRSYMSIQPGTREKTPCP